ncbi:MAG: metal-sulfur cluster assembly factor [Bacteroidetes bacterium]|nr:metal-sulfur cluster assembly factor [Bacteroidota bacterium]
MNVTNNNEIKSTIALAGLQYVIDPEIGLNIVDLGLVYDLYFDEENKKVLCTMTLTTEFCPMGDAIVGDTTSSLESSFPGYKIEVKLTFDPPWSYDSVSEQGKQYLGM